jgi:hypothetical protein
VDINILSTDCEIGAFVFADLTDKRDNCFVISECVRDCNDSFKYLLYSAVPFPWILSSAATFQRKQQGPAEADFEPGSMARGATRKT